MKRMKFLTILLLTLTQAAVLRGENEMNTSANTQAGPGIFKPEAEDKSHLVILQNNSQNDAQNLNRLLVVQEKSLRAAEIRKALEILHLVNTPENQAKIASLPPALIEKIQSTLMEQNAAALDGVINTFMRSLDLRAKLEQAVVEFLPQFAEEGHVKNLSRVLHSDEGKKMVLENMLLLVIQTSLEIERPLFGVGIDNSSSGEIHITFTLSTAIATSLHFDRDGSLLPLENSGGSKDPNQGEFPGTRILLTPEAAQRIQEQLQLDAPPVYAAIHSGEVSTPELSILTTTYYNAESEAVGIVRKSTNLLNHVSQTTYIKIVDGKEVILNVETQQPETDPISLLPAAVQKEVKKLMLHYADLFPGIRVGSVEQSAAGDFKIEFVGIGITGVTNGTGAGQGPVLLTALISMNGGLKDLYASQLPAEDWKSFVVHTFSLIADVPTSRVQVVSSQFAASLVVVVGNRRYQVDSTAISTSKIIAPLDHVKVSSILETPNRDIFIVENTFVITPSEGLNVGRAIFSTPAAYKTLLQLQEEYSRYYGSMVLGVMEWNEPNKTYMVSFQQLTSSAKTTVLKARINRDGEFKIVYSLPHIMDLPVETGSGSHSLSEVK